MGVGGGLGGGEVGEGNISLTGLFPCGYFHCPKGRP